ncbi:cytochrome/quinol oxidase subunit 3 [Mesorhizobium sp. SARCC-RB16n]|uniref:cytochrome c oxidase subunit 3 n=1 Tax=Mesorhizobium sp. SARCC-RB16n TaxID=2116687 RepID=UPI00122EBC4A|nr:cytochrome c oxidase subunit 3 [Mesorhizobium sp. SARCC-RB16n]KAA3450594.1 cytochrome/quinol oxidase subunit 3 [Mesorhizobium sp. SARCC-RB16n]
MSGTESVAFDTPQRERRGDNFAMWVFIASEAMLFGAIFLVFLVAHIDFGRAFAGASKHLSLPLGTFNTVLLITSSFTMALAHMLALQRRWRATVWALLATSALGVCFLVVKGIEYGKEIQEGLAPLLGLPFRYSGPDPVHAEFFFGLYFAMTSLHALHLIGGIVVITGMIALWRTANPASRLGRVVAVGLYWHFVDIIWVFMFPVLYLINR